MLKEFRFKNYRSFKDEQVLSLEPMEFENKLLDDFNLTGKKSPTSIGGAMNCPMFFRRQSDIIQSVDI